jgi:cell wall-associated NlpC family hydrolase
MPTGLRVAIVAVAVPAIFCTIALPAYAARPSESIVGSQATAELQQVKTAGAQTTELSSDVEAAASGISRDAFSATSEAQLAAAQAEAKRAALRVAYASYTGPSARDFLANPPYPSFSLSQVVSVGMKYQGVPYRYGGDNPSGFDCSGFTMFVYAQFGVALPHSASRQGSGGIPISPADAQPGDLVVMDGGGHIGIYLGGNLMLDAPKPGRVVGIDEIYSSRHWFVRYGA